MFAILIHCKNTLAISVNTESIQKICSKHFHFQSVNFHNAHTHTLQTKFALTKLACKQIM